MTCVNVLRTVPSHTTFNQSFCTQWAAWTPAKGLSAHSVHLVTLVMNTQVYNNNKTRSCSKVQNCYLGLWQCKAFYSLETLQNIFFICDTTDVSQLQTRERVRRQTVYSRHVEKTARNIHSVFKGRLRREARWSYWAELLYSRRDVKKADSLATFCWKKDSAWTQGGISLPSCCISVRFIFHFLLRKVCSYRRFIPADWFSLLLTQHVISEFDYVALAK